MKAKEDEDRKPADPREWIRVRHFDGKTTVTVTLMRSGVTVRWTTKTFANRVASGLQDARSNATRALAEMEEVLA